MTRIGWMLVGLAALAPAAIGYEIGTTVEARRVTSALPVTTAAANVEARPSGDHARSADAAPRCQAGPVDEEIVLPEVTIYGHVPRHEHVALMEPDPEKVNRLYAGRADDFQIDGLTLTSPEAEPSAGAPAVRIADDLPALGTDGYALTALDPSAELPHLQPREKEDSRLPRSAVGEVLRSHQDALEVCYATATRVDPWLPGTADLRFAIGKDGHAERVQTHVDGLHGSPTSACMRSVVSKLAFAPPALPIEVRVHFGAARRVPSSGT